MSVLIRRMTAADVEAVALLDGMCFSLPWPAAAFGRELTTDYSRPWVAEVRAESRIEYRDHAGGAVVLSREAGQPAVVAFLVLWRILDEAHIATLGVHPDYRRRGLARDLLRHALDEAAREGATHAMLEVRAGNRAAQKLYEQFGFEIVGRRRGYYKDNGEDALLLTLRPLIPSLRAEAA